jgi:perosamine synthetase
MTFLKAKDYDISVLGDRAKCIPGAEPILNRTGVVVPVCEPDLSSKTLDYVSEAITSSWVSSRGKYLDLFETEFAKKVGAKYAVAVNSGTSALYLALASFGLEEGDEVIMPAATMISTAFAVSYLKGVPVFVDCDEYYQLDPTLIEAKITDRTKVIMPVHIYGQPVDCDAIEEIARRHNLTVIYDAAESHGAEYKGKPIGNRGLASCYSFYGNKIITTGEGGMVVSDNEEFISLVRNLKDVAFSNERHFWHKRLGYNFRMTNLAAAVGLSQTERFEELVQKHIDNAHYYTEGLKDLPLRLPLKNPDTKNVFWMYGYEVLPEFGMTRDQLRKYMAGLGVESRTFFVPMHLQPYYQQLTESYPIAERLSERGMYIPSSSKLTKEQMDRTINAIKEAHESI